MKSLLLLTLVPLLALATNPPSSVPTPTTATSSSSSSAASLSVSGSSASGEASAAQQQTAQGGNGGKAIAHGGTVGNTTSHSGDSAAEQFQSANNEGNSLAVTNTHPRQAPSTAQGSLMIGACGAGGNAGGSNTGGSAFLGVTWTPADCKLLLAAAAYQALGMSDAACEMVNGIKAVKARWKALGVAPPSCEAKPVPVAIVPPAPKTEPVVVYVTPAAAAPVPDTSAFATKEYVQEVWKRSVGK